MQVLRMTASGEDAIIEDYDWHNKKEARESFLGEQDPEMPLRKEDRRGTFIDIHTNDATLFNLGYTARIT